ncbi:cuticle protein CP1158-like [Palaemon carinicauda]|uniref:cuticle protein CP1158-like n=1 Tax=Palaemon carinicauda TaxID=392227 RepID=UPI0035B61DEA
MKSFMLLCMVVAGASAANFYRGIVGQSGIVNYDGNNVQFTREQAENIVLVGPSGVVTRDGKNMQRLPDHIVKRDVGFVNDKGSFGLSGVVRTDGTIEAFSAADIDNIVLIGPSGVVTKDGRNWHLDENLHIRRSKRSPNSFGHTYGPSGIVSKEGKQYQLPHGVEILIAGPAHAILSNGEIISYYD